MGVTGRGRRIGAPVFWPGERGFDDNFCGVAPIDARYLLRQAEEKSPYAGALSRLDPGAVRFRTIRRVGWRNAAGPWFLDVLPPDWVSVTLGYVVSRRGLIWASRAAGVVGWADGGALVAVRLPDGQWEIRGEAGKLE